MKEGVMNNGKLGLWRVCEVFSLAMAIIAFCSAIYFSFYFVNTRPSVPMPSVDRIYVHNVHGKIAYLNGGEHRFLNALFWVAGIGLVIGVFVDRYKRPFW